jgi:hypothetical protein
METPPETQLTPKPLKLDIARYQHYLDATRLSPDEKEDLLNTLWNLTCEFVYLGFGISSVQQATALETNPQRYLTKMRDKADQNSLDSTHPQSIPSNPLDKEQP